MPELNELFAEFSVHFNFRNCELPREKNHVEATPFVSAARRGSLRIALQTPF